MIINKLNSENNTEGRKNAILNTLMYLLYPGKDENGEFPYSIKIDDDQSFSHIVDKIHDIENKLDAGQLRQLRVLDAAVDNNKELGNLVIGNQSSNLNYDSQGLNACTFADTEGNISVVFRGTGQGEWIDNGEGLSGIPEENTYNTYDSSGNITNSNTVTEFATDQQTQALNYFNQVAAINGWTTENNITITGHSKGGNKAQFVTMNSEIVDNCYSFDGQGFSPEAISQFKELYGEDYKDRIEKMYSFAADNDFVNVLGDRLIPKEHLYFFEAPIGDKETAKYHFTDAILSEKGTFNKQAEPGELSKYIENLSTQIMSMDPATRQYVTKGIMGILQKEMGFGTPVNGDGVSSNETKIGITLILEPAITDLLGTEEGLRTIGRIVSTYGDDILEIYYNIGIDYGAETLVVAIALTLAALSIATPFIIDAFVVSWIKNTTEELISLIEKYATEISESLVAAIYNIANNLENWYNKNLNVGYIYAAQNPFIKVDTWKLTNYAQRLQKVNKRIKVLDARFDKLYTKSGLLDLYSLIQADLLTGYSWRLERCVAYLNDTARDFEVTERNIKSAI